MKNTALPPELVTVTGSESKDFVVKARRATPFNQAVPLLFFGVLLIVFASIFIFAFVSPLFSDSEVHLTVNGVPTVADRENVGPLIVPVLFISVFLIVGIGLLYASIYSLFKQGGYFVGTPTRLIHFQNGKVRSIDWEQFSGDIEVSGDTQKGTVSLQLRSGRIVNRRNNGDEYVPDVIYMSGIPDAFAIEKICRARIKENDQTLPQSETGSSNAP